MKGLNRLINTAELAERYYSKTKPGRYDRTGAVKQLGQDRHLNKGILVKILKEMLKDAIGMVKV